MITITKKQEDFIYLFIYLLKNVYYLVLVIVIGVIVVVTSKR